MTEWLVAGAGAACAAAGAWMLWRQRQAMPPGEQIRLVTSRFLGGKRFLTIVEVDGERLLLGVTADRVSLLARLGDRRPVRADGVPTVGFAAALRAAEDGPAA